MGQLCHGDTQSQDIFKKVENLPGPVVLAAVGLDFTLLLLADGRVFGCGSNENGELGLGKDITNTTLPRFNGMTNVADISTGLSFALYIKNSGKVFGSGSNLYGQLCSSFIKGVPRIYTSKVRLPFSFLLHTQSILFC